MEYSSSLSNEWIPDFYLLNYLESYFPQFPTNIVEILATKSGMSTEDERVYRLVGIATEIMLDRILEKLKKNDDNSYLSSADLEKALETCQQEFESKADNTSIKEFL